MLLAAHCVELKKNIITMQAELSFFRFQDNLYDEGPEYYISEIIVHPDWDTLTKPYEADIAIAILKKPVEFSSNVRNICLNSPSRPVDDNFIGWNATVGGWGPTEDSIIETVDILKAVTVPIVDRERCTESTVLREIYSETFFCAGKSLFIPNYYDLSSKLVFQSKSGLAVADDEKWSLVGIDSVKNQVSPNEMYNLSDYVLYTDVAKFHSWINRVIMETKKEKYFETCSHYFD